MVTVEVKLTRKEMYEFLMRHNYLNIAGVISTILSLGALLLLCFNLNNDKVTTSYKLALLFIGLLFTVIQPIMLYFKAGKQVNNNGSVNRPLVYEFRESTFTISCEDDHIDQKYEDISKIIETKLSLILYLNRYRAFILPKNCIGENTDELKKIFREKVAVTHLK